MKEKITAIFIIILVLVIPIYSASVYAGLSNLAVRGTDGVNGYVRREDFAEFTVTATIDGDEEISPNQVRLKDVSTFDSCALGVSGHDCSLRIPETGTKSFTISSIPFNVELYSDAIVLIDNLAGSIVVDSNAPVITSFSITPETTVTGTVTLEYEVEDYAFVYGDTSKCSGIEKIEFYEDDLTGTLLHTETLDTDVCSAAGTTEITVSGSGTVQVCAKAYDRLMQGSAVACDTFLVDNEGPVIDPDSLTITDIRSNEISYFSDYPINAVMKVDVLGDDLDKNSVSADLSELNPSQASYQNLAAVCGATSGGTTTCVWNFILNPGSGGAKNIIVKARDNFGNEAAETFIETFTYDNLGPVITSLRTDRVDSSGNSYASSSGNTFIAVITEDVGVSKEDMLLHVRNTIYSASNCTAGWTCYWNNVNVNQQSGTITAYIGTDSKDLLGNHVAEEKRINVTVDSTVPVVGVDDIVIHAVGGVIPAYQGYAKTGDILQIVAKVSDTGLDEAYADLSAVITNAERVTGQCDKLNNSIVCAWTTAPIDVSGYIYDYITFFFIDNSGNIRIVSKEIEVFGLVDEEDPNYWKSKVSCMPKTIDRQVGNLLSQRVYCHVSLSSLSGNPETMSISEGGCRDSYEGNSMTYIEDTAIMNNVIGSRHPYLKLTLKQLPLQIDQLDLTCDLHIISKLGNQITQNYETEEVPVTIKFYNMPLGELSRSAQMKLDAAKDNILVNAKWIGSLNKLVSYADTACRTVQTLNDIGRFWKSIGLLFSGVVDGLLATAAAEAATVIGSPIAEVTTLTAAEIDELARMTSQSIAELIDKTTKKTWADWSNTFCKAISCRLFYDEIWKESAFAKEVGDYQRNILDSFDKVATLGGNVGIEAYASKAGMDESGYERHLTAKLNPRESIILSGLTLCLPGVIYNLEKLRQIECMYADCLEVYTAQGLPLKVCAEQRSYGQCKYVVGEFFQFTPLALMDSFASLIKQALSTPWGVIDITMGMVCTASIFVPFAGAIANLCLVNNIFGLAVDVGEDLIGLVDEERWEVQSDYCRRLESGGTEEIPPLE